MSTRCQIAFVREWTDEQGKARREERWVYRHSDGYPKGVLPDVEEFIAWNAGRNGDVEYAAANFLYWSKRKVEEFWWRPKDSRAGGATAAVRADAERMQWSDRGSTNCSQLHIGFGVCQVGEMHGDIEYFYEVVTREDGKTVIIPYRVVGRGERQQDYRKNIRRIRASTIRKLRAGVAL